MRRRLAIIAIGVTFGVSGCGGDGSSNNSNRAPSAGSTAAGTQSHSGSRFPGVYAETLRLCSQTPIGRVARSARTTSTNPAEIARAMARNYLPRYRAEALRGCSAGLKVAAGLGKP